MAEQLKKKDDGELSSILIACGIFTVVLLIIDFTYGNMRALLSGWVMYPYSILHAAIAVLWVVVIKKREDPNYDWYRKALLAVTVVALLVVLFHRAGYIGEKMFKEEVDKNKQEQKTSKNDTRASDRAAISSTI